MNITIPSGTTKRLLTGGKYCLSDILVTAEGSASRLPDGYTELTYIESTGTQYIDMGVKPNQNTQVEAVLDVTTNTTSTLGILGCRVTTGGNYFALWEIDGVIKWQYARQTISSGVAAFGRHTVFVDGSGIRVDGALTPATNETLSCNYNMLLFAVSTGGTVDSRKVSAKVYSCKVYDNGTLIRDFVPCRNLYGEIGLYDLVGKAFYCNAGTGSFVGGAAQRNLSDGYTQVEYIQSSGTQCIDSGFKPNQNSRVVMDVQMTAVSSTQFVFCSRGGNSEGYNNPFGVLFSSETVRSDFGTSRVSLGAIGSTNRVTIDKNKAVCTVGGTSVTNVANEFQTIHNLFLLVSSEGGTPAYFAKAKLYSCQIYDNGALVRDYVPCKNPSGAYGLYDMVNEKFYGNAGSGSFTGA